MTDANFPRRLRDEETLIFLHIFKTAGSTFNGILASLFPWEQIRPFLSPVPQSYQPDQGPYPTQVTTENLVKLHKSFSPTNPETGQLYRLILGHWDFGIVEQYPSLIPITFLRDPITQMLSTFKHLRRNNDAWNPNYEKLQRMSVIDWANSPDAKAFNANPQARQLAGCLFSALDKRWTANEIIERAQKNLERCAFIGLTERFEESLLLLAYTFNWKPIGAYTRHNVAPQPSDATSLNSREYEAVRSLCELDIAVYEYAKQLYNQRLSSMMQNLFEGSSSASIEPPQSIDPAGNIYAKRIFYSHLRQQTQQRLGERSKETMSISAGHSATINESLADTLFDQNAFVEKFAEFENLYNPREFEGIPKHFKRFFLPTHQMNFHRVMQEYPHYVRLLIDHPALYPAVDRYAQELQSYTQGPFPLPGEQVMQGVWLGIYKTKHFPLCEVNEETLQNKRVLDIGCNAGFDSFYFSALGAGEIIGIDPSPFLFQALFLRSLYHCPNLKFFRTRWQDITPSTFGTFDVVNCQGILYHEPSPIILLETIFNLLQPGGKLVLETHITLKNDANAMFIEDRFRGETTWWWIPSTNVTIGMLRACGFVDVQFRASVPAASRNPDDPEHTVEGVPVGGRAFFTAFRPMGKPVRKI